MQKNKTSWAIFFSIALVISFLFTSSIYADNDNARLYKISVLVFKHSPADKNTAPRLINRWTEKNFLETIDTNSLLAQPSELLGSNYTLSRDKNYSVLYNSAWVAPLENEIPAVFHFHKIFDDSGNMLDGLINITLKYNLDVHFQTQLLTPNTFGDFKTYKIIALDEFYQTPSNQLQYIDGPEYGALVLITRYNGN